MKYCTAQYCCVSRNPGRSLHCDELSVCSRAGTTVTYRSCTRGIEHTVSVLTVAGLWLQKQTNLRKVVMATNIAVAAETDHGLKCPFV